MERMSGHPRGPTPIVPTDTLTLYGRVTALEELDQRRKNRRGDQEHTEAVVEQQGVIEEEEREDPTREPPEGR